LSIESLIQKSCLLLGFPVFLRISCHDISTCSYMFLLESPWYTICWGVKSQLWHWVATARVLGWPRPRCRVRLKLGTPRYPNIHGWSMFAFGTNPEVFLPHELLRTVGYNMLQHEKLVGLDKSGEQIKKPLPLAQLTRIGWWKTKRTENLA